MTIVITSPNFESVLYVSQRVEGVPYGIPSPTHPSGVQLNMPQSRVWPTARAFTPILLYTIILCTCVVVHPGVCSSRA